MTRDQAVALLRGLVAIPSLSRQEAEAAHWLVEQMAASGYARAYMDETGNAVGEIGPADAERVIMLLGHIDTVPGNIPVEIVAGAQGDVLYGRGSVDAKGPLATFVAAGARVGHDWAVEHGVRVVVVGAVEEEAATSKGARAIRSRFNGVHEPAPTACIIGEPSSWSRVTLGYKGRLLVEMTARQPMAHTAGPDAGVATVAVDLWNWIVEQAAQVNAGQSKAFEQLMPSIRHIRTDTTEAMQETVHAQMGLRLPPEFDAQSFVASLVDWAAQRTAAPRPDVPVLPKAEPLALTLAGETITVELTLRGYERTWRSPRDPLLVRSFLGAIRAAATDLPDLRPSFVVKTGTSDMNVVAPVWGCPIVAYGPGDSSLDHTPEEHLSLDEYWRAIHVVERTLRNLSLSPA